MHPEVHYVATLPGSWGEAPAFAAEFLISAGLMLTVLVLSSREQWRSRTGRAAATLVALYITFEAPVSGMSMNPARTLGSALPAQEWRALWIYFVAPPLGMLTAAALFARHGRAQSGCAKLDHDPRVPCIFCDFRRRRTASTEAPVA
jgi:aquaporin Z